MSRSKGRPAKLPAGVEKIDRADGRISYRGRVRDSVTGQRYSKSFDTPEQASAWRVAKKREIDDAYREVGVDVVRRQTRPDLPTTMSTLGDAYLSQLQASLATRRSYTGIVAAITEFFGADRRVSEVDRAFVLRWVQSMVDGGLARGTRAGRVSVLRNMFTHAMELEVVPRNPCVGVTEGRGQRDGQRRLGRYPTEQEIIYASYFMPGWAAPAVFVAADSGLRRSELCALVWSSVDLDNRLLWVGSMIDVDGQPRPWTKRRGGGGLDGEGQAWVPMSGRTAEALRALRGVRQCRPGDRVFRRPNRDHVAPSYLWRLWARARAQAMDPDLGDVRLHDLRWHTATTAADHNIPMHVIMSVMRHSSPRMTHRYVARPDITQVAALYDKAFV